MTGIATLTQKGQVVIPLPIRKYLGLETSDKLYFELEKNKIIIRPVRSPDEAMGMIPGKKVTKPHYKKTIAVKTASKFSQ